MSKPTLDDVREFIRHANAEELRLISGILANRHKHLQAEVASDFERGERVWFIHGKRSPRRITGEVVHSDTRKGIIFVKEDNRVAGPGGWNWRVSPTLLKREVKP